MATALEVGEIHYIHGKGVIEPVLFMAIHITRAVVAQILRAEAPFVIIVGTLYRTFTELERKAHRSLFNLLVRLIMDFHLQRLVRREVLRIRFEQARHAHFLPRTHVVVIQDKRRFLERSIRIRIAFRHRIRGLDILLRIFAVVNRGNLDVRRIACRHGLRNTIFGTIHFDNLGIFICGRAIKVRNGRLFPSVAKNSEAHNLDLRFGNARIKAAQPHTRKLRFRENFLVVATRRRNNRIVLVQRNTPPAPTVLELFEISLVCIRKIDSITDKANVHIKRAVPIDIFGIIRTFAQVIFCSVNACRRVAFVVQILEVIAGNILRRDIHICRSISSRITARNAAIPHNLVFIGAYLAVKAAVMLRRCHANQVFTIIDAIRLFTVYREVFANEAQVDENGTGITTSDNFDVLHLAHILIIRAVRAHDTAPRIAHQVIVRTQRHLEHGQVLVIDIGIANVIVNVLVQLRIVAVPDKFTFMTVIQIFDVSRWERINATRRRCRIPGKSRQRIHKTRRRRFEVFHKRGLVFARVRIVAATGKFRFDAPVRSCRRADARNRVHQVRERLDGILQADVEAPEEARIRFVAKRRDFGSRALAPVKGGNAKHRTGTKAIKVKRQFRTRTQEELVIDFKQRLAFKLDLDFLVRVQSAVAQKFNLAEFVVDFVVGTADKRRRTCRHLFGTRRNIHAASAIDGIARIRVTHAQHRITALAHRLKVESACVTVQVINRKRIELSHRR